PSAPTSSSSNHFSKVWLYSNSRLPPHLPPLKVYIPTYPLLNLAAQYSLAAYAPAPTSPLPNRTPSTTTEHIPPSLLSSNKAMVLKSVPLDSSHTIVLAIRGSQSFADWAVNFRPQPAPPTGFLDDPGNLCHAGFLGVARGMVAVVAKRLRKLVDEKAQRGDRAYSLLLTGHSAGGAVAALLYAHMLSSSPDVASALSALAPAFRRVHCVTFGAPPVSLLPLGKPDGERCKKSLFFGFVNEGDPVVRADKEVLKSLVRLWATAAPSAGAAGVERLQPHGKTASWSGPGPRWPIPPGVLSCAGRLVLLREGAGEGGTGGRGEVEAYTIEDEMLRGVVFGDPVYHLMGLYKERIERLADRAVRGGDG
ncbi:alpha/beta-hydrolase, partial [Saccharata proteae CBS 121410]